MKTSKNTLIGKTCFTGPIKTLSCDAVSRFNPEQNTIILDPSKDDIKDFVNFVLHVQIGFVLDIQDEYALVALSPIYAPITYRKAKEKTPTGAYIPEAWEVLKYEHILRQHWLMIDGYWLSGTTNNSHLCSLFFGPDYCLIDNGTMDGRDRLFAGYFTKVPLKQLHIIK